MGIFKCFPSNNDVKQRELLEVKKKGNSSLISSCLFTAWEETLTWVKKVWVVL